MAFLASEFGYSLSRESERFVGHLRPSQLQVLMSGISKLRKKEADASKPGKRVELNPSNLHTVPGFNVQKKKRG